MVIGTILKNFHRSDANKDDKFGTLSSSHCGLVELAAAVLYRVLQTYCIFLFIYHTSLTGSCYFDF